MFPFKSTTMSLLSWATNLFGSTHSRSLSPSVKKVPLTKILDPLDFEKYISENQPVAENDADSKLLEFPDDDIEVTTIQRQHRTVYPYIPKDPG